MAKRKGGEPEAAAEHDDEASGTGITASVRDVTGCVAFHDAEKDAAVLRLENAKAALEPLEKKGLRLDAVKAAMKLRKLRPHECRSWLDSFHHAIASLGLDAQIDLLDTIQAARRLRDDGCEIILPERVN